jgi:hypothetical protein
VTALIFFGQHRYRYPIEPLLIVLAAGGACRAWRSVSEKGWWLSVAESASSTWRARRIWIPATVLMLGFLALARLDSSRIEAGRRETCRERMTAVADAILRYRSDHHRAPEGLVDLLPQYLPNIQALHCPSHSLSWDDYQLLKECRPAAASAVSYVLTQKGDQVLIGEVDTEHLGGPNRLVVELPAASPAVAEAPVIDR